MLRCANAVLLFVVCYSPVISEAQDLNPHERLERMHAAAEHLEAAGLEEEANAIRERAEQMEIELHEREQPDVRVVLEHLRDLRHQLEELKSEVRELREELQQADRRPQIIQLPGMISPSENKIQKVPDAWNLNMPGIRFWTPPTNDLAPNRRPGFDPYRMTPRKESPRKPPENDRRTDQFQESEKRREFPIERPTKKR